MGKKILFRPNAAKIPVISKNASNKNYSELNFIQKT